MLAQVSFGRAPPHYYFRWRGPKVPQLQQKQVRPRPRGGVRRRPRGRGAVGGGRLAWPAPSARVVARPPCCARMPSRRRRPSMGTDEPACSFELLVPGEGERDGREHGGRSGGGGRGGARAHAAAHAPGAHPAAARGALRVPTGSRARPSSYVSSLSQHRRDGGTRRVRLRATRRGRRTHALAAGAPKAALLRRRRRRPGRGSLVPPPPPLARRLQAWLVGGARAPGRRRTGRTGRARGRGRERRRRLARMRTPCRSRARALTLSRARGVRSLVRCLAASHTPTRLTRRR